MDYNKAFEAANRARKGAYAPYSNFFVSAALKLKGKDEIITGVNIENASYGATICAERSAVFAAITQHGIKEFEYLVLITEKAQSPCGMCLQVLSEFCPADFPVILASPDGIAEELTLKDFLPRQFVFTTPR